MAQNLLSSSNEEAFQLAMCMLIPADIACLTTALVLAATLPHAAIAATTTSTFAMAATLTTASAVVSFSPLAPILFTLAVILAILLLIGILCSIEPSPYYYDTRPNVVVTPGYRSGIVVTPSVYSSSYYTPGLFPPTFSSGSTPYGQNHNQHGYQKPHHHGHI